MTARAIVHSDDVLSGRWHFEGTTIPIAAIRNDFHYGQTEVKEQYRFMNLTDDEIAAALAFDFPAIRQTDVSIEYASVIVSCACGENTQKSGISPEIEKVACPCGRTWQIGVTPLLEHGPSPA